MNSIEKCKANIQSVADKLGLVFVEKERDFAGRYYFMSLKTADGQYVRYNPCEENKETGEYTYLNSFYNAKFEDLVPEMANDKWNILAVIYGDDEETTYEDAVKEFAEWLEKLNNLCVVVSPFLASDQKGGFVTQYALTLPKTREIKLTSGIVIKDARAIGCGVIIANHPDTQFMVLSYSPLVGFYLNLHSCRLDESALPVYKKELEEMSNILIEAKEALDSSI